MNSNPQGAKEKMLNGYPMDWACTTSGCSHANRFHHDVSGRCTIASCLCRIYSPTPIVPENPNSDKHHLAAKATRLPTSGAPVAPPVAPEGRKGLPMPANPTVLGTCDYVRYELHVHVPTECINWKPQAEPLRESQPSGVEDDGPLSVCAECGMPKCDCGVEGEGPTEQYDAGFHAFMEIGKLLDLLFPHGYQLTEDKAAAVHACAKKLGTDLTSGIYVATR